MATSLALLLIGKCLEGVWATCEAIRSVKLNNEELRELGKLILTVQPVLEDMGHLEGSMVEKLQPGLTSLNESLDSARSMIEEMSRHGRLKSMLWYQLHRDRLRHVHDGIMKSISAIQLVSVDISATMAARLQQLASDFAKWKPSTAQSFEQIVQMLDAQQEASVVRHAQVMESIERLVETMGMGIPQLMRDIDSCIETEDSLSSKQVQGLQLLQKVCVNTQDTLHRMWREPDEFELQELLGRGASGEVYKAADQREGGAVAVKLAYSQVPVEANHGIDWLLESDSPQMAAMRRELCVVARAHDFDHVCSYLGVSVLRSKPAIIMKYYERGSLAGEISQGYRHGMPEQQALRFSRDILCGLDQLHSAGILVLDVKPANLLLTDDDRLVLADFGLARALMGGTLKTMTRIQGTPEYMAPEHMVGDRGVSAKADIWAFGATLVHMLSGSAPFSGLRGWQIMHRVVDEGQAPELPSHLEPGSALADLLQRCFAREPEDRPSAAEALAVVDSLLQQYGEDLMTPSAKQSLRGSNGSTPRSSTIDELLQCPLCKLTLDDPVMLVESCITFCRACITAWLDKGSMTCPVTGRELQRADTAENQALKSLVLMHSCSLAGDTVEGLPRTSSDRSVASLPTLMEALSMQSSAQSSLQGTTASSFSFTLDTPQPATPATSRSLASVTTPNSRTSVISRAHSTPASTASDRQSVLSSSSTFTSGSAVSLSSSGEGATALTEQRQALLAAVAQCSGPNVHVSLRQVVGLLTTAQQPVQLEAAAMLCQLSSDDASVKDAVAAAGGFAPLVRLLQAKSSAVQQEAARSVACLCSSHRVSQDGLAAAGAVQHLVPLLRRASPVLQQQAAKALHEMCSGNAHNTRSVAAAGALEPLVAMLHSQPSAAPAASLLALVCAGDRGAQERAAAAGALEPLLKMLMPGKPAVLEAAALLSALVADCSSNKDKAAAGGALHKAATLMQSAAAVEQQAACQLLADLCSNHIGLKRSAAAGSMPLLLKLLRTKSCGVQQQAARCLGQLASGVRVNQDALVAAGAVPALVHLVETPPAAVQEQAALALAALAADQPRAQATIGGTNAIQLLVRLLHSRSPALLQAGCKAVAALCEGSSANQTKAAAAGAVEALVKHLTSQQQEVQEAAAGTLAAVCTGNIRNRKLATDGEALRPLVMMLSAESPAAKAQAAVALAVLCDNPRSKEVAAAAGATTTLVRLLQQGSPAVVQEQAAALLAVMADGDRSSQESIAACGGIPLLVALLESLCPGVQAAAAGALASLVSDHRRNQERVAASGAIVPLVRLLEFSASAVQQGAAAALAALAKDHSTGQDLIGEAGAAEPLVQLLYSCSPEVQEAAARALARLGEGHRLNRRRIIMAGAVEQLVRLCDHGSPGVAKQAGKALQVFRGRVSFWKKLTRSGSVSVNASLSEPESSKCVLM